MTGELHHLLRHSLVGAGLPEQIFAPAAFRAGLERGLTSPDVLPQLLRFARPTCWVRFRASRSASFYPAC
jgi:2-dehydro-3-deoxygalactonokinase